MMIQLNNEERLPKEAFQDRKIHCVGLIVGQYGSDSDINVRYG